VGSDEKTDCICNAGYTGADGFQCSECPVGTYKTVNGSSACTLCAVAQYSGAVAATDPATCLDCPAGSSAPEGSDVITDCKCNLGYTSTADGTVCTACPAGQYKPTTGVGECTACVPGKYSESVAAFDVATCLDCPANTYAASSSGARTDCTCNAGYNGDDGTACVACPTGSYKAFTGEGVCTNCAAGKYSTEPHAVSQSYCTSCAQYADSPEGSSSGDMCICQLGYYGPGTGPCQPCEEGSFCALGQKGSCTANSNSPAMSPYQANCTCNAGFSVAVADGPCETCPSNTYKEVAGNQSCSSCPANSVSLHDASASRFYCACSPGYYGDLGGPCTICPADSWCLRGQQNSCPPFTESAAGSDEQTDCHAKPGYSCASGDTCDLCAVDHYCPGGPQPNIFACPSGKQAPQGMSAESQCVDASTDCEDPNAEKLFGGACRCRGGFWGDVPAGDPCVVCTAGSYCPGGNVRAACTAFSSSAEGSSFAASCQCDPGYYADAASQCAECESGKWCFGGEVNSCPQNTGSPPRAVSQEGCAPLPGYCSPPGMPYVEGESGYWCDASGTVQACPDGFTSPVRSSSESNCTAIVATPAPAVNKSNTTELVRDGAGACGSGSCSVGFYRQACADGGECVPCTTPALENAAYTSAGVPFDADQCQWACSDGFVQQSAGKCIAGGVEGTVVNETVTEPEVLPAPEEGVVTPIIVAAMVAGGAGVVLGSSAGVWYLQRARRLRKIGFISGPAGPQQPVAFSIVDDTPAMPEARNAWSDEVDLNPVEATGAFHAKFRRPVMQNPFLQGDGYNKPDQNARDDITVQDYVAD